MGDTFFYQLLLKSYIFLVYMCMCMCTDMCVCMHVCVCECVWVCACVPLSVCACLCHYVHEYVGTHVTCAVSALKSVLYMCICLQAQTLWAQASIHCNWCKTVWLSQTWQTQGQIFNGLCDVFLHFPGLDEFVPNLQEGFARSMQFSIKTLDLLLHKKSQSKN